MSVGLLFSPGISELFSPLQSLSLSKTELLSSGPIRLLALFIILYRAGLGLDKADLRENGLTAIKLSFLPCLTEVCAITLLSHYIMGILWIESAMLAFVIAAVSPAVIVPMMLKLQEDKIGTDKKKIPTLILASATLDDILAITGFGVCLSLLSVDSTESPLALVIFLPFCNCHWNHLWPITCKAFQKFLQQKKIHVSSKLLTLLFVALLLKNIEESKLFPFSYLLAIMTFGFAIRDELQNQADDLAKAFQQIWKFAEIVLFVLIGAMVNLSLVTDMGLVGIMILLLGLLARSLGVFFSLTPSKLNIKEKLFCAIAYLPKATVQATIGGIALSYFYDGQIKLFDGVQMGEFILAMAAMSIVLTAPLGAIGIRLSNQRLLAKEN